MGEDKKGRGYTRISGIRRNDSNLGQIEEKNVQRNPLPPVGSFVIVLEEFSYSSELRPTRNGIHSFYQVASSYTDAWGCALVYEVKDYSTGIENPLDPKNKIHLVHYYGGDRSKGCCSMSLMAKDVAIGIMRLDLIEDGSMSSIDPASLDTESLISRKGVGND